MKDILVLLNADDGDAARIDAAAALVHRRNGHLTGLHVIAPSQLPGYIEAELPEEVRRRRRDADEALAARAAARFDDAMRRHGLTDRSEWRLAHGDPTDVAVVHSRYADLVVVGQNDPQREGDTPAPEPEDLLFYSGRPILLIPHTGRFDTVGERIVVAWNASREAARAVGDAMPLLTTAHKVVVMAANPRRNGPAGLGDLPCADIARHLSHHHCRVEATHIITDEIDASAALLNLVSDTAADLVVMGAYGGSRMREMILGGMTRFMLRHATTPILMSH